MTQFYEIRVKDHLDESWAEWFDGMKIHHEDNGETRLTGALSDQAALYSVLNRLRDLGAHLVSLNLIEDQGQ